MHGETKKTQSPCLLHLPTYWL